MGPIRYAGSNDLVKQGDVVLVSRRLRRSIHGTVNYVFNSESPVKRELNDYGVSILLENGDEIWIGGPLAKGIKLIRRTDTY